jgi:hypothetical protein
VLLRSSSGQIEIPGQIGDLSLLPMKTGRTMNTMILENFITFLTRGRTQNFDLEQRNYDHLRLSDITRYGFLTLN